MSRNEQAKEKAFWGASLVLALLFFHLGANPPQLQYTGFSPFQWSEKSQCVLSPGNPENISCESTEIQPLGNVLEFEFRNTTKSFLLVERGDTVEPVSHSLPVFSDVHPRQSLQVDLGSGADTPVRLRVLLADNAEDGSVSFRKRVNFYSPAKLHTVRDFLNQPFSRALFSFIAALALVNFLVLRARRPVSSTVLTALFFVGAFLVHWRWAAFFWWDDWHVLERFIEDGFSGAWVSHNEHFIPLFFSFFFWQIDLFGADYYPYLLVSLLSFALNCTLVFQLVRRLSGSSPHTDQAALLCAAIYAFSSLQSQLLQWTMVQCIALAQTFVFLHLLLALDYQQKGSLLRLLASLASLSVAMFLFANSFSALPVAACLLAFGVLRSAGKEQPTSWKTTLGRGVLLLFGAAAAAGLCFAAYRSNKEGVGHVLDPSTFFENLYEVFIYVYTGAAFGTVLRGTGAFPSNALSAADTLFSRLYPVQFAGLMRPEVFFSHFGLALCLALLLLYLIFRKYMKHGPWLWLLGTAVMLSAFVLPGIGRWSLGLRQALSLRYQHAALFGLVILLLPLALFMLQGLFSNTDKRTAAIKRLAGLLKWLLIFHFALQFYLGSAPTHPVRAGIENRAYIDKLIEWRRYLETEQTSNGHPYDFHGASTDKAGAYPLMPKVLTPGRSPDHVYRALHALSPARYPLETPDPDKENGV